MSDQSIILSPSELAAIREQAYQRGKTDGRRERNQLRPRTPIPIGADEVETIRELFSYGHKVRDVIGALKLACTVNDFEKRLRLAGYAMVRTLMEREFSQGRGDVFNTEQLAEIQTLLGIPSYTVQEIAERYADGKASPLTYLEGKLKRSGFIIGWRLVKAASPTDSAEAQGQDNTE